MGADVISAVHREFERLAPHINEELRTGVTQALRTVQAANNPKGAIIQASSIALCVVRELFKMAGVEPPQNDNLFSWVERAAGLKLIDPAIANYFHNPRFLSNKADHQRLSVDPTQIDAAIVILQLVRLCQWLYTESTYGPRLLKQYGEDRADSSPLFNPSKPPGVCDSLAAEMQHRRTVGDPLVLYIGLGSTLASPWYEDLLTTLSGSRSYDDFRERFGKLPHEDRHRRLGDALRDCSLSPGYLALGRLVASGWFNIIVTATFDNFLEESLGHAGLQAGNINTISVPETSLAALVALLDRPWPRIKVVRLTSDVRSVSPVGVPPEPTPLDDRKAVVLARLFRRGVVAIGLRGGEPALDTLIGDRGEPVWLYDLPVTDVILRKLSSRKSTNNIFTGTSAEFESVMLDLERVLLLTPRSEVGGYPSDNVADEAKDREVQLLSLQDRLAEIQETVTPVDSAREADFLRLQSEMSRLRREIDLLSNAGEGTILGNFRLLDRLGRGGSGSVFRARHLFSKVEAAIKVLDRDRSGEPQWVTRFFRGAQLMYSLNHPNIVRIVDPGGKSGCWCYYVMEFVDGPSLEAVLEVGCLESEQKLSTALQVLEAMAYAHCGPHGCVVHRDLKPANILVTQSGVCKLTDFDMAYIQSGTALSLATAASFGTPFYIAPELETNPLLSAQHDARLDVYALGRILLRLFAGIPPRESLVSRLLNTPDGLRSALSASLSGRGANLLCSIILKATDSDPGKRFADAGEFVRAFLPLIGLEHAAPGEQSGEETIEMRRIPAGKFLMGSNSTEGSAADGVHEVTLSKPFLLSATPVTRRLWASIWGEDMDQADCELPIENVSWYGAVSFCNALSTHFGFRPVYRMGEDGIERDPLATGFRLPTEGEWEYACRASTQSRYYLGDEESDLHRCGWYARNCQHGPMPVRQKEPNGFGLFDMLGNVWEWCWDWYAPYLGTPETDPTGPTKGSERVLRGGSWRREAYHCSCGWRYDSDPRTGGRSLGFRVARNAL